MEYNVNKYVFFNVLHNVPLRGLGWMKEKKKKNALHVILIQNVCVYICNIIFFLRMNFSNSTLIQNIKVVYP